MRTRRDYEFSDLPNVSCTACHKVHDAGSDLKPAIGQAYQCPHCQVVSYVAKVDIMPDGVFNVMTCSEPNR